LQRNTGLIFPVESFASLVAEIGQDFKSDRNPIDFEPDAILALQTASEEYLVDLFEV
jgi:histone H3/H4